MAPHSTTLAWRIPWMEEPGGLQSMGSQRVGHDWATSLSLITFMHWRRKWQPTPVFLPGESQRRGSLVGCRLWASLKKPLLSQYIWCDFWIALYWQPVVNFQFWHFIDANKAWSPSVCPVFPPRMYQCAPAPVFTVGTRPRHCYRCCRQSHWPHPASALMQQTWFCLVVASLFHLMGSRWQWFVNPLWQPLLYVSRGILMIWQNHKEWFKPSLFKWQPPPGFLPGESHGQRSLAGYSPRVAKSQTQLSDFTSLHFTSCMDVRVGL